MKIVPVYNRWIQQRCCQSKGIWHNFWWQHPHIVQYSTSFVTYVFFIWFFLKIEILPRKKHRQIEWISNNCNIFKFGSHWLSWWYFSLLAWFGVALSSSSRKTRIEYIGQKLHHHYHYFQDYTLTRYRLEYPHIPRYTHVGKNIPVNHPKI